MRPCFLKYFVFPKRLREKEGEGIRKMADVDLKKKSDKTSDALTMCL